MILIRLVLAALLWFVVHVLLLLTFAFVVVGRTVEVIRLRTLPPSWRVLSPLPSSEIATCAEQHQ